MQMIYKTNYENPVVFYHAKCFDGYTSYWIVGRYFNENRQSFKAFPAHHHTAFEHIDSVEGADVIFVDFVYKPDVMEDISKKANTLTILDHHEPSFAGVEHLFSNLKTYGVLDNERSGAMLTWDYFFAEKPAPLLVQYVQDRDLYRFDLPHSRAINSAIGSYEFDLKEWELMNRKLNTDFAAFLKKGETILDARDKAIQDLIACNLYKMKIDEFNLEAVHCHRKYSSDIGSILANRECNDFGAAFDVILEENGDQKIIFSLRSISGKQDVSEVAKRFGGGGHRNASGMSINNTSSKIKIEDRTITIDSKA